MQQTASSSHFILLGELTFPFSFSLPADCPLSYIDDAAETLCSLTFVGA